MSEPSRPKANRTLEMRPGHGEMLKPSELIDLSGAAHLTLADRRLYNVLIRHAFGPDLGITDKEFEIELSELRDTHESNDRLAVSIEALMTTVVRARLPDGSTDRFQLLGPNNLADPKRRRGTFRYSIPAKLAEALKDSTIFAKLEIQVLKAFTSKYALSLYEAIARRYRLRHVTSERFDLETFREEILAVPEDKLTTYGNLNQFAIKPALREVNALAEFHVTVTPEKIGRRVVGVVVHWYGKDVEGKKAAWAELQRSSVGRKARIAGTVEEVIDLGDQPSSEEQDPH